ncbi:hypothetical protein FLK61_39850 [Paenalkalicoccus suaedae]|uniref:N-acetyltransferase domain-containing protein n=1 Tax=Paenalkalicoccus suaedae TaxID=2592382 RepID=A0A859FHZ6_9BACI|nr:hypothetical protein [Paenalkalicoccus suaedae]QKS72767.1 hypothetical protein FLK61_39850 [Paenalkalicoccus suaedae]
MAFYIEEMSTARQAELDRFWAKIGFTATPDWQIFAANTLAHEIVGTIAVQMIEGDACVRGLIIDAAHKEKSHVLLLALVHAVVEARENLFVCMKKEESLFPQLGFKRIIPSYQQAKRFTDQGLSAKVIYQHCG